MQRAPDDVDTGHAVAASLHAWYPAHARSLPWRRPPGGVGAVDPYAVLVSEIVLQQTTVAVGTKRIPAFLDRFPTVHALAQASDAEVADAWAGLGYYRRARNLAAAARASVERHGGVPVDEAALLDLPGVGPYTAAAVSSIAGGRPSVVVDGNVERVMARVHAIATPLPQARRAIRAAAAAATPSVGAGDHAQAVMDLAALVCRPKAPKCLVCPLRALCLASASGEPERYPVKPAKKARPVRRGMCTVLWGPDATVALERRGEKGMLPGTFGLPGNAWDVRDDPEPVFPFPSDAWRRVTTVRHVFSHFALELDVWVLDARAGALASNRPLDWLPLAEARVGRLPSVFAKALEAAMPFVEPKGQQLAASDPI